MIESLPNIAQELKKDYGFDVNFERAKHLLEENDGAGNTFKATAKPVLIGTAVVGSTTMIFSIIVVLTHRLQPELPAVPVDPAPAVPARPDHRRLHDLLVHRRVDPGGHDRRLPGGRVHQGEHQARRRGEEGVGRRQQEGGRDLHPVCAEGDVQHLPGGVLRDAGVCLPGAVLLHRLPDLDRAVRAVPGDFHGERRRRVGQRQEDCRGRAEGEGHAAARGDGGRATPSATRSRTPRRWR